MTRPVVLHCRKCGRTMDYDRTVDPDLPPTVARIESAFCDAPDCDEPDSFHTEDWYDASGQEIIPD